MLKKAQSTIKWANTVMRVAQKGTYDNIEIRQIAGDDIEKVAKGLENQYILGLKNHFITISKGIIKRGSGMSTVSIVIATYKGSKYIGEQLESIRVQDRPADEVWILDDRSPDNTATIVSDFIENNKLRNWHLIVNEKNLGWKRNFRKGFDFCTGDYIFPCDQDDIWHKDKLRRMIAVMEKNPNIKLLTSNYNVFTSNGSNIEEWYKKAAEGQKDDDTVEQIPFTPQWAFIVRPGCSYCVRRSFFDSIKKEWNDEGAHDAQLYRWAHMLNGNYVYNAKLMDYRRHGDNETAKADKSREKRIQDIDYFLEFHNKYLTWCKLHSDVVKNEVVIVLKHCISALKLRKKCIENRRVYLWPVIIVRYADTMKSWKGCLVDLKCSIGRR